MPPVGELGLGRAPLLLLFRSELRPSAAAPTVAAWRSGRRSAGRGRSPLEVRLREPALVHRHRRGRRRDPSEVRHRGRSGQRLAVIRHQLGLAQPDIDIGPNDRLRIG